ncbi:hypothetical protein WJX72_001031 [[Myrmecia] bisecta]|uniref:Lon protease homolog n=1 Tax=[Myrmecia] bisecta TaxID=41462 RepID=A0AAW1P6G5_9CHLO
MPISINDQKLVSALLEQQRSRDSAYVGVFLRERPSAAALAAEDSDSDADEAAREAEQGAGDSEQPGAAEPGEAGGSSKDKADDLHSVGTFAQVHAIMPHEHGAQLLLLGHRRLRRLHSVTQSPLTVAVEHLKDLPYNQHDPMLRATTMEMVATLKELIQTQPLYSEQLKSFLRFGGDYSDASRLADVAASLTNSGKDGDLQAVLEELSVPDRATAVLVLLKKDVEVSKLQAKIAEQVQEKLSGDQRRYFLMEQLKSIKKELGLEKDDKSALILKFRERLEPLKDSIPEHASRVIEEELEKLSNLEPASSEFNVTRNYLDWLTSMPWGRYSEEKLDVASASTILEEDHYGLEDVKERILEFIAVGRLRGSTQGKILCLVGPPGVGKTSIGRSVARALDRKYFRFSVGGLGDVAEIKGHRRTYVGAMPGKIVQCLKSTETSNPFMLIDEIDKLGRGVHGDPASALLELLDPEQNSSFVDHYLDVPVDLSKVLFMCTANMLDTVPGPLLDRMEVIRISGYIADEKRHIARKYLEPQSMKDSGVPPGAVDLTDEALDELITEYCREAGVRNLKKKLERIYRKVALKLVQRGVAPALPAPHHKDATAQAATDGANGPSGRAPTAGGQKEAGPQQAASKGGGEALASAGGAEDEELEWAAGGLLSKLDVRLDSGEGTDAQQDKAGGSVRRFSTSASAGQDVPAAHNPSEAVQHMALSAADCGEPIVIGKADLKDYVGQPPFPNEKMYSQTPVGVVMGLAWTAMGGSCLYVEAASVESGEKKSGMRMTGQLGDVMKESVSIAHTFTRSFLGTKAPAKAHYFNENSIHVHVPAGATPKDGPSAGCTMITALLSLALNKPVRPNMAMTGEVSLTGRVLPIGGVKEKTLAARRSGVRTIIFPAANKRDWEELSKDVREGLDVRFAEAYEDVYRVAFEFDKEEGGDQHQAYHDLSAPAA